MKLELTDIERATLNHALKQMDSMPLASVLCTTLFTALDPPSPFRTAKEIIHRAARGALKIGGGYHINVISHRSVHNKRLALEVNYRYMNSDGFYEGTVYFNCTVEPLFDGSIDVKLTGRDRKCDGFSMKEVVADAMHELLAYPISSYIFMELRDACNNND